MYSCFLQICMQSCRDTILYSHHHNILTSYSHPQPSHFLVIWYKGACHYMEDKYVHTTALLWQKEASDKLPKSEKVMFLYWTRHILLPLRVWSRNTPPAERYLSRLRHNYIPLMPILYMRHILLIYKKCHFQELLQFVRVQQTTCIIVCVQFCVQIVQELYIRISLVESDNA